MQISVLWFHFVWSHIRVSKEVHGLLLYIHIPPPSYGGMQKIFLLKGMSHKIPYVQRCKKALLLGEDTFIHRVQWGIYPEEGWHPYVVYG